MGIVKMVLVLAGASTTAACIGGPPKCETLGRYQLSQEGRRIQAPDDLDDLASFKEMTIPQASPRTFETEAGRCLEMPPALTVSDGS